MNGSFFSKTKVYDWGRFQKTCSYTRTKSPLVMALIYARISFHFEHPECVKAYMLWVLKWAISMRWFVWAPKKHETCLGYLGGPSQWDGSFELPGHVLQQNFKRIRKSEFFALKFTYLDLHNVLHVILSLKNKTHLFSNFWLVSLWFHYCLLYIRPPDRNTLWVLGSAVLGRQFLWEP